MQRFAMPYTLVIGNKNYSSWSLRAWLFLRASGLDFDEVRIPLFVAGWRDQLARYSPAGRVPVLVDARLSVWDSTEDARDFESGFEHVLKEVWNDGQYGLARTDARVSFVIGDAGPDVQKMAASLVTGH